MKKLLLALLLALAPLNAFAALNASTTWELRTTGNDTNGGGFTTGISTLATATDLAVNASTNTIVSSATLALTSASNGRYLQVTAGTGFTTGFYRIISVDGSGNATLDASPAAVSTTGGSVTLQYGLDYTQQNAKNANGGSNGSSVLGVTAGTTTITCSDCQFTQDIVGNVIYITGGTGSVTSQRYAVTGFTSATAITVDRSTGLTAGTGTTINVGGAIATFDELLSARGAIGGNHAFVKASGTYTTSAGYTTALNPLWLTGYTTTRGDNGQATLQSSAGAGAYVFKSTATLRVFNMIFDCNSVAGCNGIDLNTGGAGMLSNVTADRYDGIGILLEVNSLCDNCEAKRGTTNATAGIKNTSTSGNIYDSYVHDGNGPGIVSSAQGILVGNIVTNQAGSTADGIQCSGSCIVLNNTIYTPGRHCINITSTGMTVIGIKGNLLVNCGVSNSGFGILTAMTTALPSFPTTDGNACFGTGSGCYSANFNDRVLKVNGVNPYVDTENQALSGVPFVSTSTPDWNLNTTAGQGAQARAVGVPQGWAGTASTIGHPDMGAVTRPPTNYAF